LHAPIDLKPGGRAIRKPVIALLLALALAGGVNSWAPGGQEFGPAWAQGGTGSISGRVFHDIDGDGNDDNGEPGVRRARVQLTQGGSLVAEDESDRQGQYSISGVAPGDYTLATELDEGIRACWDVLIGTFDPLAFSGCTRVYGIPWQPTLPESVPLSFTAGEAVQVDFGGAPTDLIHLVGRAIKGGEYARQGDSVEAFVNGTACGATTIGPNADFAGALAFELIVFGDEAVSGCAAPGDVVEFRVAGVTAQQTLVWMSYQQDPGRLKLLGLAATGEAAWYWFQGAETANLTGGASVQASIGGIACGAAIISVIPLVRPPGIAGFTRLVVPPNGDLTGCGRPGSEVEFAVGGIRSANVVAWAPGLHRIELTLPTPTATLSPAATPQATPEGLPDAGGSQGGNPRYTPIILAVVVLVSVAMTSLLVMACRVHRSTTRKGDRL